MLVSVALCSMNKHRLSNYYTPIGSLIKRGHLWGEPLGVYTVQKTGTVKNFEGISLSPCPRWSFRESSLHRLTDTFQMSHHINTHRKVTCLFLTVITWSGDWRVECVMATLIIWIWYFVCCGHLDLKSFPVSCIMVNWLWQGKGIYL